MSDEADAGVLWSGEVEAIAGRSPRMVRVVEEDAVDFHRLARVEVWMEEPIKRWIEGHAHQVAGHLARLLAEAQRERDEAIAKLEDYEKLSRERAADQAVGLMRGASTPQRKRRLSDVTDTPDNIARRGEGLPDEF